MLILVEVYEIASLQHVLLHAILQCSFRIRQFAVSSEADTIVCFIVNAIVHNNTEVKRGKQ